MRRRGCIEKNDPSEAREKKKESGSLGEKKKNDRPA